MLWLAGKGKEFYNTVAAILPARSSRLPSGLFFSILCFFNIVAATNMHYVLTCQLLVDYTGFVCFIKGFMSVKAHDSLESQPANMALMSFVRCKKRKEPLSLKPKALKPFFLLLAIIRYLLSFTRPPNGSHLLKLQDFRFTQMGI